MTALWCDSFEDYTDLLQRYTIIGSPIRLASDGRYGTAAISLSSGSVSTLASLTKVIPVSSTLITGVAYYGTEIPPVGGSPFIEYQFFGTPSSFPVQLYINPDWTLSVRHSATHILLATSALALVPFNWYYIEFKVTMDTSGYYEVRIGQDGHTPTTWILGTGDTSDGGSNTANQILVESAGDPIIDDLYIINGTSPYNTDFLGDVRVLTTYPIADGTYRDWTPSTGTDHFSLVSEVPPDTSTWVLSTTSGSSDTYSMTRLDTFLRDCDFIQLNTYAKTDTGQFTPTVYTSGSRYFGTARSSEGSFAYSYQIWERRPDLGNAWTGTSLNNAEFGVTK